MTLAEYRAFAEYMGDYLKAKNGAGGRSAPGAGRHRGGRRRGR